MTQAADASAPPRQPRRLLGPATLRLVYMRLLALGFLALGLWQWSVLLGAIHTDEPDFFSLSLQSEAVILFFAVANLVAAVGLWLTATWGVVIWFAAAGGRIIRHTVFASSLGWTPLATAVDSLSIILFILIVLFKARADRREVAEQRESRRNRASE